MVWRIRRLRVLKPIRFESVRRNEVGSKIPAGKVAAAMRASSTEGLALYVDEDRQQRAATVLRDVAYVIEAQVELTARGRADPTESVAKHLEMARRARAVLPPPLSWHARVRLRLRPAGRRPAAAA